VSEDYLSQIERGLKTPTIGLLHQFARILGVRVSVLLGEPEFEQNGTVHAVASELNQAMLSYGTRGPGGLVDLVRLRDRADAAWSIWQTSPNRYTEGSAVLPELIGHATGTETQEGVSNDESPGRESLPDLGFRVERHVIPHPENHDLPQPACLPFTQYGPIVVIPLAIATEVAERNHSGYGRRRCTHQRSVIRSPPANRR
jgi:transcriptional regulator with XRE-family HTH domain